MKEKIVTVKSEFVDYKGITHNFIVAAVSTEVDTAIDIYDGEGNMVDYAEATKAVKIGVAVCNPLDKYDEEKGKMIAICKARNSSNYALYATLPGMINTAVVNALISQEVAFIKNNPDRVIPGYNEEKIKYMKRAELNKAIESLTDEEKAYYYAVKNNLYPKVKALLEA